jgi:hypothetical protein
MYAPGHEMLAGRNASRSKCLLNQKLKKGEFEEQK